MTVTVARGAVGRMRAHPGSILVQVQAASDPEAAAAALEAARADIYDALEPNFVSELMPVPDGPTLWVNAGKVESDVGEIAAIVARRLEEAGVAEAVVDSPKPRSALSILEDVPRAVVLRLYGPPPRMVGTEATPEDAPPPLPEEWVEAAAAWAAEGKDPDDLLWAWLKTVEFPLPIADAGWLLAGPGGMVVAANPPDYFVDGPDQRTWTYGQVLADLARRVGRRIRGASAEPPHCVALAAGGPDASDAELVAHYERLVGIARRLAPHAAYGYVRIAPCFTAFTHHAVEWVLHGGPQVGPPGTFPITLCDEIVFDGFAYQILGPGHLARLGGTPSGAEPLPGGRVGLTVGPPEAWLPDPDDTYRPDYGEGPYPVSRGTRDPGTQDRARAAVAGCLLTDEQAYAIHRARYGF